MAEPTWRDKLQAASFRGVAFKVESTGGDIGRRVVIHEYPQRELPFAEDMGRKAREFTIEAFVIGNAYMDDRDKLITAVEKAGSGELVHPYRGRMQVVVTSCRVSESTAEGGMAKFSLSFTESGEKVNEKPKEDTQSSVGKSADAAQAETESSFLDNFSVDGWQDYVPTEALSWVSNSLTEINGVANRFLSGGLLPEFTHQLFSIASTASSLIHFPATLASSLYGQVKAISGIASNLSTSTNASNYSGSSGSSGSSSSSGTVSHTTASGSAGSTSASAAYRALSGFGGNAAPVPNSIVGGATFTLGRQQQAVNQTAVISLIQRAAVIEAARVSTQITPASYSEAIALRNELADKLEALAETAPDKVYTALMALRIAVIKDITARVADLSRTVSYTVPVTLPALVVTYSLYGSVENTDSLIDRNKIRHPGFVPGGQAIEVLTQ